MRGPLASDELADYGGGYEFGGNGFDSSGHGCEWDGVPIKCDLHGFVTRSQQVDTA